MKSQYSCCSCVLGILWVRTSERPIILFAVLFFLFQERERERCFTLRTIGLELGTSGYFFQLPTTTFFLFLLLHGTDQNENEIFEDDQIFSFFSFRFVSYFHSLLSCIIVVLIPAYPSSTQCSVVPTRSRTANEGSNQRRK